MKKKDYLDKLLGLCTEKQTSFFYRMYPNGPDASQVSRAIQQVESTLANLNTTEEELKLTKKEADEAIGELNASLACLGGKITATNEELKEANALIDRLSNPINTDNNEVQERLNLLDALEAGGVDNWEWYDESVSNYRGDNG